MLAVLAAILTLSASPATVGAPEPLARPHAALARASSPASSPAGLQSPLPQPPRDVRVRCTPEGHVITWRRPAGRTESAHAGYIVLVDEQVLTVAADRHRVVVAGTPSRVAVASTNGVGSSLLASPDHPTAQRASAARAATRMARGSRW